MEAITERVIDLAKKEMSCGQMMYLLSGEYHGQQDEYIIRSLDGLSTGMHTGNVCGAYSGACCIMGLYMGKTLDRTRHPEMTANIEALNAWFIDTYESLICTELLDDGKKEKIDVCLKVVENTYLKTIDLMKKSGVDLKNL